MSEHAQIPLLAIAIGGAGGALVRYWIVELVRASGRFEGWAAVLAANLGGCLLLGVFAGRGAVGGEVEIGMLAAGVGFCGSLTTMSALALDLNLLYSVGRRALAAGLLLGSWCGGLVTVALGQWLGGRF